MNLFNNQSPRVADLAVFLGLLLLTAILYWPGLYGDFIFDDGNAITENTRVQINRLSWKNLSDAAVSKDTGLLLRPVSMVSFAINHVLTGLDPFYFKLTNLFIHLATGFLLLLFLQQVFKALQITEKVKSKWLILFIVAAWLLHPLNVSGVLYVVQRMASLSAFFVLLGMVCYATGRNRMMNGRSNSRLLITAGLFIPGLLAVFSKENGALLPVFMFVTELTIFRFQTKRNSDRYFLIVFFSLFLFVPSLIITFYTFINPEWILDGYFRRDFTLTDRLLSETRILFLYLGLILFPDPGSMGLFHDDFILSRGLLDPPSTLFAVAGILLLIVAGFTLIRKSPVIAFGILWFFAAHLMESTIIGLEPVFEHRNYLAMIGPLTILFYLLFSLTQKKWSRQLPFITISSIILFFFSLALIERTNDWSSSSRHILSEVKNHPDSSRANDFAGLLYEKIWQNSGKDEHLKQAKEYFQRAAALNDNAVEPLISLISLPNKKSGDHQNIIEQELLHRLEQGIFHPSWFATLQRLVNAPGTNKRINIERSLMSLTKNKYLRVNDRANLYNLIAIYFDRQGEKEKAGHAIRKAVEIRPDNLLFRLGLAHWLRQNTEFEQALETLADAESLPDFKKLEQRVIAERARINKTRHQHD